MILKKEFYFIRHGQTDHNISLDKIDHSDISLNATGRMQALYIAPRLNQFSFQTICCSPFKRAKETKELLFPKIEHQEILDLGECRAEIWNNMTLFGKEAYNKGSSIVRNFLDQVKRGLNQALEHSEPILIIAHGGTHWAICYWMNIEDHNWIIDNCQPVHFSINQERWKAKLI